MTRIWETSLEKYLGFPMLKGRARKEDFNFIIDKMHSRLASWKLKLLNKAGRMTLAKSVLTSIPIYYMQLNWIPSNICKKMDQITRNFIWRRSEDKGINLVICEKISQPKRLGGISIHSARDVNTAMLGKFVWDMHIEADKLWVQMLSNEYVK